MMKEKTGYQIAVERIEEVARTGAPHLDLSGLGLTKVPANLFYIPQNPNDLAETEQYINLISDARPLRVLLCYAKEDVRIARDLSAQLQAEGWLEIWLEEVNLLPEQNWNANTREKALQSDAVILLLSNHIMKLGYLPKEFNSVLEILNDRPDGTVFVIPLRLDNCRVLDRLSHIQCGDYFPEENQAKTYQRLLESLKFRARQRLILPKVNLPSDPYRVFLCYSKQDKTVVRELYERLSAEGWMDVWLDDASLTLGQNWELEIDAAIQVTNIVIPCFSTYSVSKEGYYQKELKYILDKSLEKPIYTVFVLPLRLDDCRVPESFVGLQHMDYFPKENQNSTYYKLVQRIKQQAIKTTPKRFERRAFNLRSVDLSNNQLTSLPAEIGQFIGLTELKLDENRLVGLPPEVCQISNLTSLLVSHNQIISLPVEIGRLTNLIELDLKNNKLSSLPLSLKNLKSLGELDARENPLPIPPEILNKVQEPQSILNYLVELLAGQRRPLAETKMLVVGQGSVGKTSLIRRLIDNSFSPSEIKTDGIAINRWQVPNKEKNENQPKFLRVNIWDFGGQEIMHATHQFFLTHRSLYMLVLDARISQEENRVEYWLKIIQSFGGESPVLIVGNKTDQHPLDIDFTGLRKKYPNIVGILDTSAANGEGLRRLKSVIAEQVNELPHIRDSLPEVWFNVKNQLEELGHVQNYISQEKYTDTCIEGEIRDETSQRTLIGFLHDLGIVLHFQDDPRLESLGILNPQWVTNGVYKILNARDIFDNKGVMTLAMLNEILDSSEYPSDKRLFIVEMMRKFELCYDIDRDKFLIPDLLPISEPFVGEKEWEGALAFQYHYNVLPSSIITRFIVRMNALIYKTVWRSGVVLKKDDNTALVKADTEDRKIYVWVNGAENTRRDFLSVIRAEFDAIHKTIIKIEAREKVPVPGPTDVVIDFEHLLKLERMGETTFIPEGLDQRINVRELLNGVRVGDAPAPMLERAPPITPVTVVEQKSEPVAVSVLQRSMPVKIFRGVFVEFPKIVGRIPLDIVGKGKDAADSTLISLGYGIIILILLVVFGYVGFDALITMAKDIWRFFFPVKP